MRIRLGTRQSPLALWQAHHVTSLLEAEGHSVELVKITTSGDVSTTPLGASGGVGVFTKEIQRALLDDRCDLAVHSLKDLPTAPVPGLRLAAVPQREEVADCLLSSRFDSIDSLPEGARVGTGSPRRRAQLLRLRPDLELCEIRGNVDTRIKKMEGGEFDAILLAYAGLHRLKLDARITQRFTTEELLPAVGQAALGLETRDEDSELTKAVESLRHTETHFAVLLERTLLRTLEAGCLTPLAALATLDEKTITLSARVFSDDFTEMIEQRWKWERPASLELLHAIHLGEQSAADLDELGASELIHPERF
ncbi:hydroxymethylbilane synthase [Pirellulaceae bacterium SH501]